MSPFVGFGTIINVILGTSGGIFGLILGKKVKNELKETLLISSGFCLLFMSIGGCVSKMLIIKDGLLVQKQVLMMMISMSLGSIIGELLNLESFIEKFGVLLKKITKSDKDTAFVDAFIYATCTVCIGAMAIVGSIEDAVNHNYNILLAKGIMDFIILSLLAASMGKGTIFSGVSVLIFQGAIEIVSVLGGSFLTTSALNNISYVGNILIFVVGVNIIWNKKFRTINMLPSLIIAALWPF